MLTVVLALYLFFIDTWKRNLQTEVGSHHGKFWTTPVCIKMVSSWFYSKSSVLLRYNVQHDDRIRDLCHRLEYNRIEGSGLWLGASILAQTSIFPFRKCENLVIKYCRYAHREEKWSSALSLIIRWVIMRERRGKWQDRQIKKW